MNPGTSDEKIVQRQNDSGAKLLRNLENARRKTHHVVDMYDVGFRFEDGQCK